VVAGAALAELNPQVPESLAQSLVRVRVINETRRLANGSGVAVRGDMVITSCHGTRNARWIDVLGSGQDWKIKRLVEDVEHDICLLELERSVFKPFLLATQDDELQLGDYVASVGFAGPRPVLTEGTVKALHIHDDALVIQTDAAFKGGESGGALLNREGKLVGILTFFTDANGGSFFALPARWVERLVQRAQSERAPEPQPDSAFWERPDEQRPLFLRALAREYEGDWQALTRIAEQWVTQEARNPEAWVALGKAHYHAAKQSAAVTALTEATKLQPRHTQGWYYLGRTYFALSDNEAYEDALKHLEALSPTTAEALREAVRLVR
jgi:serine protease Do